MNYLVWWMLVLSSTSSSIFQNLVSYISDDLNLKRAEGSGMTIRAALQMVTSGFISQNVELTMNNIPINVRSTSPKEVEYYFALAGFAHCSVQQVIEFKGEYVRRLGPDVEFHKVVYHKGLEFQVTFLTNNITKEIMVGFQGSRTTINYLLGIKVNMIPLMTSSELELPRELDLIDPSEIKVHEGFKLISDAILPQVNEVLQTFLSHPSYQNYTTTFIGHSLGGSIGLLTALRTRTQLNLPSYTVKIVTYGQIRTGNPAFARYVNNLPISLTRVVNQNDLVPHLPPTFLGYAHTYHELHFLDHQAHSCSTKTLEDPQCSYSQRYNLTNALHNYLQDLYIDDSLCT